MQTEHPSRPGGGLMPHRDARGGEGRREGKTIVRSGLPVCGGRSKPLWLLTGSVRSLLGRHGPVPSPPPPPPLQPPPALSKPLWLLSPARLAVHGLVSSLPPPPHPRRNIEVLGGAVQGGGGGGEGAVPPSLFPRALTVRAPLRRTVQPGRRRHEGHHNDCWGSLGGGEGRRCNQRKVGCCSITSLLPPPAPISSLSPPQRRTPAPAFKPGLVSPPCPPTLPSASSFPLPHNHNRGRPRAVGARWRGGGGCPGPAAAPTATPGVTRAAAAVRRGEVGRAASTQSYARHKDCGQPCPPPIPPSPALLPRPPIPILPSSFRPDPPSPTLPLTTLLSPSRSSYPTTIATSAVATTAVAVGAAAAAVAAAVDHHPPRWRRAPIASPSLFVPPACLPRH
ncbi:hypothetical protein I4F81_001039 [Pyropia yezoensis]|uniref:Uncharacterized protein n=1 Tax=Pyropia yezoensis TaxID=2788 RepID=A0ACC3BKG3_PYRYE|nr:hypothetical protein I4F81_001039 [Neopyropia yezoensis]